MEYDIITDGRCVMLDVLVVADESLIGLEFSYFNFKKINYDDLCYLVRIVNNDDKEERVLMNTLFINHIVPFDSIIVLETIANVKLENQQHNATSEAISVLDIMKLYKSENIYSCYRLSYQFEEDGKPHQSLCYWGGYASINSISERKYSLSNAEKNNFASWYAKYYKLLCLPRTDWFCKTYYYSYCNSFKIGITEPAYIMLFTILESLFQYKKDDISITETITKGTATFLAKSKNDIPVIKKQIKSLYKIRGDYVHRGKEINSDKLKELQEVVRKVFIELLDRGLHKKEFNRNKFVREIFEKGYPIKYRL